MTVMYEKAVKELSALILQGQNIEQQTDTAYSGALAVFGNKGNEPYRGAVIAHIKDLSKPGMSEYGVSGKVFAEVLEIIKPEGYTQGQNHFLMCVFEKFAQDVFNQTALAASGPAFRA